MTRSNYCPCCRESDDCECLKKCLKGDCENECFFCQETLDDDSGDDDEAND